LTPDGLFWAFSGVFVFPQGQEFFLVEVWVVGVEFVGCEDEVFDIAGDNFLCFGYELLKVCEVDLFAYDDEADVGAVDTFCKVADEIDLPGLAKLVYDAFYDFVDAGVFYYKAVDVVEEGMLFVGLKDFAWAFGMCIEESGCFEAVEFEAYGV
jgi:hypothetical protein